MKNQNKIAESIEKVSQQSIADELGVSLATVSLALANKYGVNPETRRNVLVKAAERGYHFKIKKSQSNIIAVLVDSIDYFSQAMFWIEILKGIEEIVHENNAVLKILITKRDKNYAMQTVLNERMNGIIFLNQDREVIELFSDSDIPKVQVDSRSDTETSIDHVLANNYQGSALIAKKIYELGHKKILYVGNNSVSLSFRQRICGFKDFFSSVNDNGLQILYLTKYKDREQFVDAENLLSSVKCFKPTVIACSNDRTAMETYELLAANGYDVERNIMITGFDNDQALLEKNINITTVNIDKKDMGLRAANLLLERMHGLFRKPETIMLNCVLVERNSFSPK